MIGYEANDVRKMWTCWGSSYYTCLAWCVTLTLRRFVLESIAKPYAASAWNRKDDFYETCTSYSSLINAFISFRY